MDSGMLQNQAMLTHFATGRDLYGGKLILHGYAGFRRATGEDVCIIDSGLRAPWHFACAALAIFISPVTL
jgi:hypothetical protein